MPKFCANCGNPVNVSQKFCTECGTANASYEGAREDPMQARTKILRELEQATLQKVDELRKLREYQQRIHHVPLTEIPEMLAKPTTTTTYSNSYMEQETLRLQKLEMLVQMEEQKLDAFRQKVDKENVTEPTKVNIADAPQQQAPEPKIEIPIIEKAVEPVAVVPTVTEEAKTATPIIVENTELTVVPPTIIEEQKIELPVIEKIIEPVIIPPSIVEEIKVETPVVEIIESVLATQSAVDETKIEDPVVEKTNEPIIGAPTVIEEKEAQTPTIQEIPITQSTTEETLEQRKLVSQATVQPTFPDEPTRPLRVEVNAPQELNEPVQKKVAEPISKKTTPKKTLMPKRQPQKSKKGNGWLLAAAAVIVLAGGTLAVTQYFDLWPVKGSTDVVKQSSIPLIHAEHTTNTASTSNHTNPDPDINNLSAVVPAGYKDARYVADQWQNLQQLKPVIEDDINHPHYQSLAWLVGMHKKLAAVDFPELSKHGDKVPDGAAMLKHIAIVNDSVQWALLKYCMEHPNEMEDQSTYMALVKGSDILDINSMYLQIVDAGLKKESSTFYKQAVIKYTRKKEQQVVSN